ncbi:hypothetical protein [Neomicrococcus lactis]|uniref:Uncharacterized protein n=1 Tax=Neomicrococcus lactis TaxID=732241 RepID=A0A7W8YBX2_9MICC|nr:hypothetical protein [Neomicrococcus lactis]MBB5598557.1 hypothetical protein [Neomicrococcus lactis]
MPAAGNSAPETIRSIHDGLAHHALHPVDACRVGHVVRRRTKKSPSRPRKQRLNIQPIHDYVDALKSRDEAFTRQRICARTRDSARTSTPRLVRSATFRRAIVPVPPIAVTRMTVLFPSAD